MFRLVSANWARLVVRRSFDLDLLEWRSANCLRTTTVEEIKSRRVAITRHQRDIDASIDILHSLAWGERHSPLEAHELLPSINLGRPNGFVEENEDKDSWWSIYWDFYELKQSMDALEKRATKIYDSIVGEIKVVDLENSEICSKRAQTLNRVAFLFSLLLLPFTVVPAILGTTRGEHASATSGEFAKWTASCAAMVFVVMISFVGIYDYWDMGYLNQHRPVRNFKSRWEHFKDVFKRDGWKGVIDNVNDQREWHNRKHWWSNWSFPDFRKLHRKPELLIEDPVDILA